MSPLGKGRPASRDSYAHKFENNFVVRGKDTGEAVLEGHRVWKDALTCDNKMDLKKKVCLGNWAMVS